MNKQFLYIEPYVYSVFKNNQILLYNTLSGEKIIEKIHDQSLSLLLNKILNKSKFRTIEFEYDKVSKETINFIDKCKDLFLLDIHSGEKPFLVPFAMKVMYDKKYLQSSDSVNKISAQINQLNIVLGKSTFCKNELLNSVGIKQFLFPSDLGKNDTIDAIKLLNMLSKIKFNLDAVNIIGDYFQYHDLQLISNNFSDTYISYYAYYLDFQESFFENQKFTKNAFVFWIDFPCNETYIKNMIAFLRKNNIDFQISFIITSNDDFDKLENLKIGDDFDKNIVPFYNKSNIDFFQENVFINETDIFEQGIISNKDIFSNMLYNKLFLGKLYFLPDNKIYPNPNFSPLGNTEDNWTYILQTKLLKNPCWFKKRTNSICANCVYQYLCPPISNYNLVLDKENLCNIK